MLCARPDLPILAPRPAGFTHPDRSCRQPPNGARKRSAFLAGALLVVAASLVTAGLARADAPSPEAIDRFLAAVDRMDEAARSLRDYTCVFTKQERIRGELRPTETMFMKHLGPRVCLYMKWIEEPGKGREAIYCDGRYENRIKAHEGSGIASWVTVSLDPVGSLALRDNRRPVTEAGLYNSVRFLTEAFAAGRKDPSGRSRFERVEESPVHGEPALCAVTRSKGNDPDVEERERVGRTEICLHQELDLPIALRFWNSAGELLGEYTYRDLRRNVGLTDFDFDVDNDAYDF